MSFAKTLPDIQPVNALIIAIAENVYRGATAWAMASSTTVSTGNTVTCFTPSATPEGYSMDMVKKLLHAKKSGPVATFTSKNEFNDWLDSLEKK